MLASGRVRLGISFAVGRSRNWMNLWKPVIDSLDPLLARTAPGRDLHPLDGRITELDLHRAIDPSLVFRPEAGAGSYAPRMTATR